MLTGSCHCKTVRFEISGDMEGIFSLSLPNVSKAQWYVVRVHRIYIL